MSKPEIQKIEETDSTETRKALVNAAIILGTRVVLPVALTAVAIFISKKLEDKSE